MSTRYILQHLSSAIAKLSAENYEQSLAFYRLWSSIGRAYFYQPPSRIFYDIKSNREANVLVPARGELFHPTAHLVVRFASDAESDSTLTPEITEFQSTPCASILECFFEDNAECASDGGGTATCVIRFLTDANLIAGWVNLGHVEERAIRDYILQSLIFFPKLYDHQADALIILFKIAGATFETYAGPSVVDRCFEVLKDHYSSTSNATKHRLVQEIFELRERGWEGLPSPPALKFKTTDANQKDPAATPVVTTLGLPKVAAPGIGPAPPVIQSPSTSITTLSDFTIADVSDDELPVDPTTITRDSTFYLEDGNVEVLCGNTLFRVHTSILSFHSPTFRQTFSQANLATAESPDGCPRILSSDMAIDFSTLLKMIYLPEFPERNKVPDFSTFSSLLRMTSKYEMPAVRSRLLEIVQHAYPEAFGEVTTTKSLGESAFSGPTPHPNEVLNLFVRQGLTSALPMAYYMAVRRGIHSLMDRRLPKSATLAPEVLQSAIGGLMALREMELNETHRLVFASKGFQQCSLPSCPSRTPTGPAALEAYREVFDSIVGSSEHGTKVLQVPRFYCEGLDENLRLPSFPNICGNCTNRWESGHADLRKRVWMTLPRAFGLIE